MQIIVSIIKLGLNLSVIFGGIWLLIIVVLLVFVLSCFLGFVVAKASQKLKNKQFVRVIISLVLIGTYYFFYFKAQEYIQTLVANINKYGNSIKTKAYPLYLIGSVGEGNILSVLIVTAITALLLFLCLFLLYKTFLGIATDVGIVSSKKNINNKETKPKSPFSALVAKEFARFTASAGYMLNCGIGIIFIPTAAVVMVVKGNAIVEGIKGAYPGLSGTPEVLCILILIVAMSMVDMATPSISLEGKSLWIPQSLPVSMEQILFSKMMPQLIITEVLVLISGIVCAIAIKTTILLSILMILVVLAGGLLNSLFCLFIGYKFRNFTWTNELVPIKQSISILFALLAPMAIAACIFISYLALGKIIATELFMAIVFVIIAIISFLLYKGITKIREL